MQKGHLGKDFVVNGLVHFDKAIKIWCNMGDKLLYIFKVLNVFGKESSYNISNNCQIKILKIFF